MRIESSNLPPMPIEQRSRETKYYQENSSVVEGQQQDVSTNNKPNEKKATYSEGEIITAIEKANKEFVGFDRRFEFSVHEKTKEIMIKVIDIKTDQIIREIPPEKILDMVAKLCELAGIFVDEKV